MLHAAKGLALGLCVLAGSCRAAPQSGAGTVPRGQIIGGQRSLEPQSGRRLHGRFLHITDVHPDPYYKTYSSTEADAACHRKRGPAGIYGAETSACDSPVSLVDETFKWIKENLRDEIDFVVWTGDSARHDNDEQIPRTQKQVVEQNRLLVRKFKEVFGKRDDEDDEDPTNEFKIPVVPTFGNNDILPHNIFLEGPNKWTIKYLDVWRNFIPEAQRHQFQQGGWFYVEVIPNKLAVISLNTIYFFDSNAAVDGCANKHEPGYEHMEWLRIQLQVMRERGMKAILMGHVPPARVDSKESWDETCWQKYTLWLRQYRDVITGSLFGHMNIDHFMLHDFNDITKETKSGRMSNIGAESLDLKESLYEDGEITVASASDYLLDLRSAWSKLPTPSNAKSKSVSISDYEDEEVSTWQWLVSIFSSKKHKDVKKGEKKKYLDEIGGKYGERFSIAHVSPSVVPNYFPTLRVFEYNITGLEGLIIPGSLPPSSPTYETIPHEEDYTFDTDNTSAIISKKKKKKEKDSRKKPKKYKFKIPKGPSKSAPPGPAYSPQSLTLLGYTQLFANLTRINNDFVASPPPTTLDEQSQSPRADHPRTIFGLDVDEDGRIEESKWKEGKHGKHQGKKPRPKPHPKTFAFELEYMTGDDKNGFGLRDLTVRSYVRLARRIGAHGKGEGKSLAIEDQEEVEEEEEENWDLEADEVEEDEEKGEVEADGKKKHKKHKKKKKKKKKKKGKKNHTWYTFVKRAFVGTMDPKDIEETFMQRDSSPPPKSESAVVVEEEEAEEEEGMEL
ncbi:Metallo-dependent phosphatase-like protein [Lophiotrema nucula]|uniref:Endopolyphosphatase n=1 Tax=Lophiotrema nucula TaxID=690887 RepID=A0A6A5YP87_9PLEO|nr:Metallo-dependent phosphatase-like protein [Lophiotrema nucula]